MKFQQIVPHRLSGEEIKTTVDAFIANNLPSIMAKEDYFKGENPFIKEHHSDITTEGPNWKVRISCARKIINTVAGYLFKPGNIKYNYANKTYADTANDIFTRNKEVIKSSQLGKIVSTQGFGYELFLADDKSNPIWIVADPKEIIPLFDNSIVSSLFCFIRFVDIQDGKDKVRMIDVYYSDVVENWKEIVDENDNKKTKVVKIGESANIYIKSEKPPLVVYKNNAEMIGDFEPLISGDGFNGLIDGYDVMCSDMMNEEDKFAWAYLLMSEGLDSKDAAAVKQRRIFQHLGEKGFVKFLTKEIPTGFFEFAKNWLHDEIHSQSHIPDFLDMSGGPLTGAALDRLLYDFEFLCATKETYFKDGLLDRIRMLDAIKNITDAEFVEADVEIVMERNRPSDNLSNAQIASTYKSSGLPIPDKVLLENFAPFIKNVDEAIAEYEEQVEAQIERFAEQPGFETEEETEEDEENIE